MVIYPILAYKSELYSNNEIVVCNMLTNSHKKVNLYPFKFVQFVEVGLSTGDDALHGSKDVNSSIYFLAEYMQKYYLFVYRMFPWPIDRQLVSEAKLRSFQFQDQLLLAAGSIDTQVTNDAVCSAELSVDKINCVGSLYLKTQGGSQYFIVLQLVTTIVAFNLNDSSFCKLLIPPLHKMIKLKL
jgi:hypothetical protein